MPKLGPTKFAIYPGSVTTYDGTVRTFTALELATAYGVQDEPYLTVNSHVDIPQGEAYFEYVHLKPRQDDYYQNYLEYGLFDEEDVTLGPDFDGDRKYTQETDRTKMEKEVDL